MASVWYCAAETCTISTPGGNSTRRGVFCSSLWGKWYPSYDNHAYLWWHIYMNHRNNASHALENRTCQTCTLHHHITWMGSHLFALPALIELRLNQGVIDLRCRWHLCPVGPRLPLSRVHRHARVIAPLQEHSYWWEVYVDAITIRFITYYSYVHARNFGAMAYTQIPIASRKQVRAVHALVHLRKTQTHLVSKIHVRTIFKQ